MVIWRSTLEGWWKTTHSCAQTHVLISVSEIELYPAGRRRSLLRLSELVDQSLTIGDGAEHAALHLHHLYRRLMVAPIRCATAVLED